MADRSRFDQNLRNTLIVSSNAGNGVPVELWADPVTHALITSTSGGGATSDVNLKQVGGATITLGPNPTGSSIPVTLATDQPDVNVNVTNTITVSPVGTFETDLASIAGTTTSTGNGTTTAGTQRVTLSSDSTGQLGINNIGGATLTLGNTTMANSIPVTIASDNTGPVILAAGSATIGSINNISGTISLPTGAATATNQTTGNTSLSTIATNTTPLVTSGGGGYVRQDSTATIAKESGGNLATIAGAITSSVVQDNVKQINGITPLMGNGTTGTGSLRVTVASDNTAFSVNAASTQSGTWTVGANSATGAAVPANAFYQGRQDGSGNLVGLKAWAHGINTATALPANVLLAEFDDVSPGSITENQAGTVRMSANRNLYVTLRDAAGNERGLNIDANNNLGIGQATAGNLLSVSYDTTDAIYNGSTSLTPTFATVTASSSGATTIVALVSSKKIRVVSMALVANAAVNVKFQSHVTPTDKTGLLYLAANGGFVLPYNPKGWFETIAGEALDINLSGAVAVGGMLQYISV